VRIGLLALGLILLAPGVATAERLQVKTAVHVHTTFSTGDRSLDELVAEARRRGLGALVLTDNLLVRFEYGVPPLRGVLRKVVEYPSVLRGGLDRYLRTIEETQARDPDVILVPGVEVIPYYYWTGSPLTGDLTMWDAQKNLLVIGLTRPEDYAALPAIGNGWTPLHAGALLTLLPGVGALVGGIWLFQLRRQRPVRLRNFTLRVERRYRLFGAATVGVGALLALDAFGSGPRHPYGGDLGIRPYQELIDFVEARRGLAIWSFPEARDFGRETVGRWGSVIYRTDPYPDALLQSRGYTAFGAIYPDTVTLTEPGRQWDRLLTEYADGRRARPAWGLGEVGYHGSPKPLDEAITVVWAADRSRAALLQAIRQGRLYAVRPRPDYHLLLDEFAIGSVPGGADASMGGELVTDGSGRLSLRFRLVASDGREVPASVRLIRSGHVVAELAGRTPFEATWSDDPPAPGRRVFYRLEVTRPHGLLSNPVFVRRPA
jgi:hypothetical protein